MRLHSRPRLWPALAAAILALPGAAQLRTDLPAIAGSRAPGQVSFLLVAGVAGNSTDPNHQGWHDIDGWELSSVAVRSGLPDGPLVVYGAPTAALPALLLKCGTRTLVDIKVETFAGTGPTSGPPLVELDLKSASVVEVASEPSRAGVGQTLAFVGIATWTLANAAGNTRSTSIVLSGVRAGAEPRPRLDLQSFTIFLQVPGVSGSSTDPAHRTWVDLSGYAASMRRVAGGASATYAPLELILRGWPVELADLATLVSQGRVLQGALLHVYASGQATTGPPLLALTLDNLLLGRIDALAGTREDLQRITATFNKAAWEHVDPATGVVTRGCWDAGQQIGC